MFTLFAFLMMIPGCGYYAPVTEVNKYQADFFGEMLNKLYPEKKYPREYFPYDNLTKILLMEHQFYVIDSNGTWALTNPGLKGDTIYAQAMEYSLPPNDNPEDKHYLHDKKYDPVADKAILSGIKLYVESLHFRNNDTAFIPFTSVKQYDIYKKDNSRDIGLAIALVSGTLVATLIILVAVAIANYEPTTTTSCPFVYTQHDNVWQLEGEVFSGAILKSLERDDYLHLQAAEPDPDGKFRLKMANFLEEIQYIDQAELLIVKHDSDVRVLLDRSGTAQTVRDPVKPILAVDSKGNDILGFIAQADLATYDFDGEPDTLDHCMNYADLTFRCSSNPDSCKLIVKGHNTIWVDHLAKCLFDKMGKKYPLWNRYMDHKPAGTQQEWVLSQDLPLQVFIKKGAGWKQVDYFDIVGPLAAREMILPMDVREAWLADTAGGQDCYTLNVRLATGYNFWEMDYAAMDFSANNPVVTTYVKADQAIDQDGEDVSGLLVTIDNQYLIQGETGNEAILGFTLPEQANTASTLFLHSRGYYHQVIEKNGNSDLAFIWGFLKPGRLSEWSYEQYKDVSAASQAMAKGSSNQP